MQTNYTYALFGGSFDPPHLGHLKIIKSVLNLKDVDKVIVVPTFLNPFKESFSLPPSKRLKLVKKAFKGENIEINSFEIEQQRRVYTVETYKELSKEQNIKYIVIGADNLKSITKWKDFEYLNSKITWIVATRDKQELNLAPLREYILLNLSIDVSSTELREGKKLQFLDKKIQEQVILDYNLNKKGN